MAVSNYSGCRLQWSGVVLSSRMDRGLTLLLLCTGLYIAYVGHVTLAVSVA